MCNLPHARHRPHSIFCILPPDILIQISKNGTPEQRAQALETLSVDHTVRQFRATSAAALGPMQGQPRMSVTAPVKQRTIFNSQHTQQMPGIVARTEGAPPSADVSVNEAYDGLGRHLRFLSASYHRNSIDDAGLPLIATRPFRPATTTTRSGTASRWSLATATASSSTASPSRST